VRFNNGGLRFVCFAKRSRAHKLSHRRRLRWRTEHRIERLCEGRLCREQSEPGDEAEGLELNQLISIEDVTAVVNSAVKPEMSAADANTARRTNQRDRSGLDKDDGLRSDVVTLYQGGQYNLYRYKKYTDVRRSSSCLKFQAAFFGRDPDNFNSRVFNIDMALVRVNENDQPVKTDTISSGPKPERKDGELVSSPAIRVDQRLTPWSSRALRDVEHSLLLRMLESRRKCWKAYMARARSRRAARKTMAELRLRTRSRFTRTGGRAQVPELMAKEAHRRKNLRKAIDMDCEAKEKSTRTLDEDSQGARDLAAYERDRRFMDLRRRFTRCCSDTRARLCAMAEENEKPDAKRLPEYMSTRRATARSRSVLDCADLCTTSKRRSLQARWSFW